MSDGVQSKKAKEKARARSRTWMVVAYPESMPENWKEILADLKCRVFVSPLHDSDKNADGELKKPHYHVLILFDSVKSVSQVAEISDRLNSPRPQKMDNARGAARYLCHLDNPEKVQYPCDKVQCFGGADFLEIIGRSCDKYLMVRQMMDFVDEQGWRSFAQLARYSRENNEEWFRALCDNCGWVMKEYMKSLTWEDSQS